MKSTMLVAVSIHATSPALSASDAEAAAGVCSDAARIGAKASAASDSSISRFDGIGRTSRDMRNQHAECAQRARPGIEQVGGDDAAGQGLMLVHQRTQKVSVFVRHP